MENIHAMYSLVDIDCVFTSDYFISHSFLLCFLLCRWHVLSIKHREQHIIKLKAR